MPSRNDPGTAHQTGANRLRRVLQRLLPPPLAEVLLPAVTWHNHGRRVIALVPNPTWEEVFLAHAAEPARRYLERHGLDLQIRVGEPEAERQKLRLQTFDTLLRDPGNHFALSACGQVLEAPGVEHNPLFFFGPPGCGKSHLLHALATDFRSLLSPSQVMEITGAEWVATRSREWQDTDSTFHRQVEAAAVFCLDGVEVLADRPLAQEQLFHLINTARDEGRQIILTGTSSTRRIPGLEERLLTRLTWGLAVSVEVPLVETRVAFLRELAAAPLEDASLDPTPIVETLAPDMHHIVELAGRLQRGERLGLGGNQASFDRILEEVSRHLGLRPADIAGKRQQRGVARARQLSLLLGRRLTGHSLTVLGAMVGGRDHSTVLYGIRQAETRLRTEPAFARLVDLLTQRILAGGTTRT